MTERTTIEDLKRQLREWSNFDEVVPVPRHYGYSSSSSSTAPPYGRPSADSPLPMSPYVPATAAELKPQHFLTHRSDNMEDRGEHISSLAFNLSQQTEYNNSLLLQVEALEVKNGAAHEQIQCLESEVTQLRGSLRISTDQTMQLEKQVNSTVLQYEAVVEENKGLREEIKNTAAEAIRQGAQAEAQRRRMAQVEDGSSGQQQQVAQLQAMLLKDREKYKIEVKRLTTANLDLETSLKRVQQLQKESDSSQLIKEKALLDAQEEGINLQRTMNKALQQVQDEGSQVNEMNKENKALKTQNNEYARSAQEARLLLAQRDEACVMLQARLNECVQQQERADEEVQAADAKWRRSEETFRQTNAEIADYKSHTKHLETSLEALNEHLAAADQRIREYETLLTSTNEQHADNSKHLLVAMNEQLAQESERLASERKKHEQVYAEMLSQVGELQKLLHSQRTESARRFADAVKSRDAALTRVAELEHRQGTVAGDKRQLTDTAKVSEARLESMLAESRAEMGRRGEQFVAVLTAIKATVGGLMVEGRNLSEQVNYLAMQQQRLGVVVHELAGNGADRPMTRPLEGYTWEVTQALQAFSIKVQLLKETQQVLLVELDASMRETEELKEKYTGASFNSQEVAAELSLLRQEKASLDIHHADLVHRHQTMSEDLGREKVTVETKYNQVDQQMEDLVRQNVLLQNELSRVESDFEALQTTEAGKSQEQGERWRAAQEEHEATVAERKQLAERLAQTQADLSAAEARVIQTKGEFNELKTVAQSFVEAAGGEKRRQAHENGALVEAVGKYQEQLQRQQQLLDNVTKSRNDLLMEVHALRSEAHDAAAGDAATAAATAALEWDQQFRSGTGQRLPASGSVLTATATSVNTHMNSTVAGSMSKTGNGSVVTTASAPGATAAARMAAVKSRLNNVMKMQPPAARPTDSTRSTRTPPVPFGAIAAALPATALAGGVTAALTSAVPSSGVGTVLLTAPAADLRTTLSPELTLGLMSSDLRQLASTTAKGVGVNGAGGSSVMSVTHSYRLPTRMSISSTARQQKQQQQLQSMQFMQSQSMPSNLLRQMSAHLPSDDLFGATGGSGSSALTLPTMARSSGGSPLRGGYSGGAGRGTGDHGSGTDSGGGVGGGSFFGSSADLVEPSVPSSSSLDVRRALSVGPTRAHSRSRSDSRSRSAGASPSGLNFEHEHDDDDDGEDDDDGRRNTRVTVVGATTTPRQRSTDTAPTPTPTPTPMTTAPFTSATAASTGPGAETLDRREIMKDLLGRKGIPIPGYLTTAAPGVFGSPDPGPDSGAGTGAAGAAGAGAGSRSGRTAVSLPTPAPTSSSSSSSSTTAVSTVEKGSARSKRGKETGDSTAKKERGGNEGNAVDAGTDDSKGKVLVSGENDDGEITLEGKQGKGVVGEGIEGATAVTATRREDDDT